LTIVSALLLAACTAHAQDTPAKDTTMPKPELSVKVGVNANSISGGSWDNSYKPGIVAGITAGMHKNRIGVRAEALVSTARYTSKDISDSVNGNGDFRAIYLNIPVLFECRVGSWLWVQLGPQYSNLIMVQKVSTFNIDPKIFFKSNEFSGVIGLEAKFPENILGGVRYVAGMSNMNNGAVAPSEKWQNSSIQVYLAYRFQ
jgi:Outer membrane protein beta-barrel domain